MSRRYVDQQQITCAELEFSVDFIFKLQISKKRRAAQIFEVGQFSLFAPGDLDAF